MNTFETLSGVATSNVRGPVSAVGAIEIVIGRLVEVAGPDIAAEIPAPLNTTDVTPPRFVPVIVD
jgi:hypothetical protein